MANKIVRLASSGKSIFDSTNSVAPRSQTLKSRRNSRLIVYNDDVNTFDWVQECLVNFCGHDLVQAEQCVYLIHLLGSYPVLLGNKDVLRPVCEWLNDLRLIAAVVPIMDKD